MLKRKILKDLLYWKNNHRNNCLMVIGARQVGKTYIIKKFAEENYENFYELNFLENESFTNIFDKDLSSNNILTQISLYFSNFAINPGKTLIFLDEIQICPNAITALKFLAQDDRIDVIVSGSTLGMTYKKVKSFPVGYVDRIYMNSLDFEEFLWARGINEDQIEYIKSFYDKKLSVPEAVHDKMMNLFKEFIILGGMPDVINEFLLSNNFNSAKNVQKRIIEDYKSDIVKYATDNDKPKIRACFDSIPAQLAKENKKFKYSLSDKNANKERYFGALEWLNDAGITNFCYNLNNLELPLEGNKDRDSFKVYMADTGLLMAMLEDGSQTEIMNGNLGIYKGAIYENIVSDMLVKEGYNLYFYKNTKGTIEMDFFIRDKDSLIPVEVKANDNSTLSLKKLIESNNYKDIKYGIKLCNKNIGFNGKFYTFPYFMTFLLKRYIRETK